MSNGNRICRVGVLLLVGLLFALSPWSPSYGQEQDFGNMPDMQFDQFNFGEGLPQADPEVPVGLLIAIFGAALLFGLVIAGLISFLFYNVLKAIPEPYREMQPASVFLFMIPIVNLVWAFFIGMKIPKSFQNYFQAQGRTDVGDCGAQLGLWWAICVACGIIPCVNYIAGPASLVLLIILLVKLYGLKGQMGPAGPPAATPFGSR